MSIQSEIKGKLEQRILEQLDNPEAPVPLLAVARQFLKDFPPEGGTATGPAASGMLAKYEKEIDKLEASGAAVAP